jgi:hypothetical protein
LSVPFLSAFLSAFLAAFLAAVARTRLRLMPFLNSRSLVHLATTPRLPSRPLRMCNVEADSAVAWRWKARHDAARPLDRASLSAERFVGGSLKRVLCIVDAGR